MKSTKFNVVLYGFAIILGLLSTPALSYVLLANGDQTLNNPQKWGARTWGTGAIITWGFVAEGAESSHTDYYGVNAIGQLRSNIDGVHGSGAFDTAVSNAFNTWATVADLQFKKLPDTTSPLGSTTVPDIRIGAFSFTNPGSAGAAGFGPPGDSAIPDPLAGDLALNVDAFFRVYPYAEGTAYQLGDFQNDLEGLLVHEIGHTLGLGHPEVDGIQGDEINSIMCVHETCDAILNLRRQLGADDIAAVQFVYGAPVPVPGALWLFGSGLLVVGRTYLKRRTAC